MEEEERTGGSQISSVRVKPEACLPALWFDARKRVWRRLPVNKYGAFLQTWLKDADNNERAVPM